MAKFLYKFRCFDLYGYKLPLGSSCHLLWLVDFHKIEILKTQPRSCPKMRHDKNQYVYQDGYSTVIIRLIEEILHQWIR